MSRNPAVCLAVAAIAISVQAAVASPVVSRFARVRCHDRPEPALEAAGVGRVTADIAADSEVGGDHSCLGGQLGLAVEMALARIAPLARERGLPCSPRCWLDRPTSAIARVGDRGDQIWPSPPPASIDAWLGAGWIDAGWLIVVVLVPDLAEGWWWIAVSPPDASGRARVEVIDETAGPW